MPSSDTINAPASTALSGFSVAITGAAQGIGRGLAEAFAQAGARLLLADLDGEGARTTARMLEAQGREALGVAADVTRAEDCRGLVDEAVRAFGRLDVMICNAGIAQVRPFMELEARDWDNHFAVNVKGAFLSLQAAARQMRDQQAPTDGRPRGKILMMASIAGRYGAGPMAPFQGPYRASKAAVISLTQTAAYSLAPEITVNAICPGLVATDMWARMDRDLAAIEPALEGSAFAQRVGAVPLGRAQTPRDVAGLALFLASPAADYLTGQSINVDGGLVFG